MRMKRGVLSACERISLSWEQTCSCSSSVQSASFFDVSHARTPIYLIVWWIFLDCVGGGEPTTQILSFAATATAYSIY